MTSSLITFGQGVSKDDLDNIGVDIEFSHLGKVRLGNIYEGPCQIKSTIKDINSFGAFSYINGRGRFTNVKIGRYCSIAGGVEIGYPEHPTTWLSSSAIQYQKAKWASVIGSWQGECHQDIKSTEIGDDVWIGTGAFVRSGLKIGTGSIIGAHAVVTKDVEPYSIVAGNPARHIRYRIEPWLHEKLLESKWWEFSPVQLSGCPFSSPEDALRFVSRLRNSAEKTYSGPRVVILESGARIVPGQSSESS